MIYSAVVGVASCFFSLLSFFLLASCLTYFILPFACKFIELLHTLIMMVSNSFFLFCFVLVCFGLSLNCVLCFINIITMFVYVVCFSNYSDSGFEFPVLDIVLFWFSNCSHMRSCLFLLLFRPIFYYTTQLAVAFLGFTLYSFESFPVCCW